MLVNLEIASGQELEIDSTVKGKEGEQVIEKTDSGIDPRPALPVEGERDTYAGLGGGADDQARAPRAGRRGDAQRFEQAIVLGRQAHREAQPVSVAA